MNPKLLKILSWVALSLSVIAVFLNANKNIWCWFIWCIANIYWIYWSAKKKEWAQFALWIVFTIANIYGWYQWSLDLK
jgi:nicotinamide riboside transporter PnuC